MTIHGKEKGPVLTKTRQTSAVPKLYLMQLYLIIPHDIRGL